MILRRAVTLRSDSWKYNLSARSASVSVSTVIVIERQTRARMPHALRCRLCSRTVRPAGCQRQSARAQAHGSVPAAHKQQKKQKKVIVIGECRALAPADLHLACFSAQGCWQHNWQSTAVEHTRKLPQGRVGQALALPSTWHRKVWMCTS